MNSSTIAVHWHDDNQPVYSVDFQPTQTPGLSPRLATGGGDNNVRIWNISSQQDGKKAVQYLSSLTKHTQAVNVVRFNPKGDILATAGDDGTVILWELSPTIVKEFGSEDDEDIKESWVTRVVLRSSTSEVYDLCWSPSGKYLATGSMDHYIRIYDVENKGQLVHQMNYHNHYIQGIAWDPNDEFLVSQSADRSINIVKLSYLNHQLIVNNLSNTKVSRAEVPINKISVNGQPSFKTSLMYHSETLQSFFRRLAFSPDGSLLLTPSGLYRYDHDKKHESPQKSQANDNESNDEDSDGKETNTVFVYIRSCLNKPILHIPGFKKAAIAISFSPIFYRNPDEQKSVFKLPYRMVFAVATHDSIIVYDTVSLQPLGVVSNVHYSTITDLAWDKDGQSIIISSADGFCSTVNFDVGVFGDIITKEEALKLLELKKESVKESIQNENSVDKTNLPDEKPDIIDIDMESPEQTPKPEVIDLDMESPQASKPQPSILNMLSKKDKQKKRVAPTLIN